MTRTTRNPLPKALIGAAAIGAMIGATPAMARDDRDDDSIGAGEIIAGAIVIGGLAAILASGDDDRRYDDRYRGRYADPRYGYRPGDARRGGGRAAIGQCIGAVERRASRYGRADVTDVTDIARKRDGYKVKGRLVVRDGYRGYDRGKFSCEVRYGRIHDIDLSGLR